MRNLLNLVKSKKLEKTKSINNFNNFKNKLLQFLIVGNYYYRGFPYPIVYTRNSYNNHFFSLLSMNSQSSSNHHFINFKDLMKFVINNLILRSQKLLIINSNRTISQTKNQFKGTLVLLINSIQAVKIFDFESKKVMTIYTSEEDFKKSLTAINSLGNSLNHPVISFNIDELIIIENYVETIPLKRLKDSDLANAIFSYVSDLNQHFKALDSNLITYIKTRDLIDFYHSLLAKDPKWINVYSSLDFHRLEQSINMIPCINFKTDLKYKNFLVSKNNYTIIDFEDSHVHSFLNLFLTYHNSLLMHYDKAFLVRGYKLGVWDSKIMETFKIFSLEFMEELKNEYYFLSLLNPNDYLNSKDSLDSTQLRKIEKYLQRIIKSQIKYSRIN